MRNGIRLSRDLSDWEVVEAYSRWDGTYACAESLAGWYGVSHRTLLRAFGRMADVWNEMHARRLAETGRARTGHVELETA